MYSLVLWYLIDVVIARSGNLMSLAVHWLLMDIAVRILLCIRMVLRLILIAGLLVLTSRISVILILILDVAERDECLYSECERERSDNLS